MAASGAVNIITSQTGAYSQGSTVEANTISILATDNNVIVSGAGALSVTVATNEQQENASGSSDSSSASGNANNGGDQKKESADTDKKKTQSAVSLSPAAAISVVDSSVVAFARDSQLIANGAIDVQALSNEVVVSMAAGISGPRSMAKTPPATDLPWPARVRRPST